MTSILQYRNILIFEINLIERIVVFSILTRKLREFRALAHEFVVPARPL